MRDMPYPKNGPDNNRGTWSGVCLLSFSDSRHTQLTECRIRGLLLSAVSVRYPQHQAGMHELRVGRFMNVT